MRAERIVELLTNYKENLGKCKVLTLRIGKCERTLQDMLQSALDDQSLRAQQYTDTPKGTNISDTVARLACASASGIEPRDIKELRQDIAQLNAEKEELQNNIAYVDAWLVGLTARERWIVEKQMIDAVPWRDVVCEYERRFGVSYSYEGLKSARRRILRKIGEMSA